MCIRDRDMILYASQAGIAMGIMAGQIPIRECHAVKVSAVSYTHLDVYKRQSRRRAFQCGNHWICRWVCGDDDTGCSAGVGFEKRLKIHFFCLFSICR